MKGLRSIQCPMKVAEHLQTNPTWHANLRQAPIILLVRTLGLMAPHIEALLLWVPACMGVSRAAFWLRRSVRHI